ncbi:glycosyltransferase family 4 protein [Leisingera sp. ANG-M7]|uniref:glycosyltransferase family 4 protein n=1 Tax=Leisingera sp. ANG-M7 TaxID=1577902 RepID=UPI00187CBEEC|nr:glycosyltransferase family 4 protein [Leisingera sp. ANG-M7]
MPKPLKILHSSETVQGGVGSYMRILSEMPEQDVEQVFLIPSNHRDYLLPKDPRVRTFPRKKRSLWSCWQQARHIRRCIQQEEPDILFLHSSFSLITLVLLKMLGLDRPVLYCPHGWAVSQYGFGDIKTRLVAAIEGLLTSLPDAVVSISQHDLNLAKMLGYRGCHQLLENAVPAPAENAVSTLFKASQDALNVLFVGRLDRQKGYDILFSAFEEAARQRDDLRLHVVGAAVRADSVELAASEKIHFAGWVDNGSLDDWYRSADVLVVPSRWEGFGLVVAEAMRNGTPVICSDRGALPDLVRENETGHIFALDETALCNCLLSLKKNDLRAMRSACLETYKTRFSMERFNQEMLLLYNGIQKAV